MTSQELFEIVKRKAEEFGMQEDSNVVIRKYLTKNQDDGKDNPFYFGFIGAEEPPTGPYRNFSLVVFPGNEASLSKVVVGLVVGSQGFTYDREMAALPGLRRRFLKLRNNVNKDNIFFKTRFDDITTSSVSLVKATKSTSLEKAVVTYKTVLPAAEIVDLTSEDNLEDSLNEIYKWVALYADFRGWGKSHHAEVRNKFLAEINECEQIDYTKLVRNLLKTQRFVVIQGAPGVGKTYKALEIANSADYKSENVFFDQFHAETTYSDFVWGLKPKNDGNGFEGKDGILLRAINRANEVPSENVLLIIDEINRANLSNVLGPVFFLFEKNKGNRKDLKLKVGNTEIEGLPDNLQVLATMNTADRSLAVVDFALRRRFIWVNMLPQKLPGKKFRKKEFDEFSAIFEMYATDEELNLQPGPSYFLADSSEEMIERMEYELMPLIKEYLTEGTLLAARDELGDYFYKHTGKLLFN